MQVGLQFYRYHVLTPKEELIPALVQWRYPYGVIGLSSMNVKRAAQVRPQKLVHHHAYPLPSLSPTKNQPSPCPHYCISRHSLSPSSTPMLPQLLLHPKAVGSMRHSLCSAYTAPFPRFRSTTRHSPTYSTSLLHVHGLCDIESIRDRSRVPSTRLCMTGRFAFGVCLSSPRCRMHLWQSCHSPLLGSGVFHLHVLSLTPTPFAWLLPHR